VASRRKNNFRYKRAQWAKNHRHPPRGANRRSIIRRWSILPGMWELSISYAIPGILANPTGSAARLKDINFLIESAKSCNDFSIDADLVPAGDPRTSICGSTSSFLTDYTGRSRNAGSSSSFAVTVKICGPEKTADLFQHRVGAIEKIAHILSQVDK